MHDTRTNATTTYTLSAFQSTITAIGYIDDIGAGSKH
jgi:hypothetical protein